VLAPQQDGRLQQLYRDFEIPEISASDLIEKLLIPHLNDLVTACEKKKVEVWSYSLNVSHFGFKDLVLFVVCKPFHFIVSFSETIG
jgi:hypothetical protein